MHPTANYLHHYALEPLARRGYAALGANTRYAGNESVLLMERVLVDVGRAVATLRQRYERVVIVGNSGGGPISGWYQQQARHSTTSANGGAGPGVDQAALEPVDALVFLNAHTSRARVLTEWLDPSIVDERDPFRRDITLDMYDPRNGPPYDPTWLARYRGAQEARNRKITTWAQSQIAMIAARPELGIGDFAFLVHGTHADPRLLDLSLDPSDRPLSKRTLCVSMNLGSTYMGRFTTLRSWLSQWGLDTSQADALVAVKQAAVPVLVMQGTADVPVYPKPKPR